jgi:uncharacterized protein YjiS (DUF1127 family)
MAANLVLKNAHAPSALGRVWQGLSAMLARWSHANDARRQLEHLDDHILRDIGFDPCDARGEAAKRFWEPYTLRFRRDR